MILRKRSLSLLLALILVVALFAACGPRTETPDEEDTQPQPPIGGEELPFEETVASITPDYLLEIADRFTYNDHTVGWIDVPGTNISDVVLRNPEDRNNLYYLRRNFQREYYFNGVFYIDFRADLGPTREYLGVNTTIYGHALTDDPEHKDFDVMFGNLHKFRDPEFAREHPYIFFSLPEENLAFEIIAIFYGNSDNPAFSYNNNPADPEDFIYVIENAVLPRSLFHYDGQLSPTDRFLTLSTCIYTPTGGVTLLHHTETQYRFGIMARLVDAGAPLRTEADFVINEDRIVDPDGFWRG